MGDYFLAGLDDRSAPTSSSEVRGRGLMLAVELHPEAGRRPPLLRSAAEDRGLLAKDTHDHTIRIAPPLVVTQDQVDWALERIDATLTQDLS